LAPGFGKAVCRLTRRDLVQGCHVPLGNYAGVGRIAKVKQPPRNDQIGIDDFGFPESQHLSGDRGRTPSLKVHFLGLAGRSQRVVTLADQIEDAGLLEVEYAGLDGEVALPLSRGRWIAGIGGSLVRKRDPDNPFSFANDTLYKTAFLNVRLNIPEAEVLAAIRQVASGEIAIPASLLLGLLGRKPKAPGRDLDLDPGGGGAVSGGDHSRAVKREARNVKRET
jgi:hypothetical protein